MSTIISYSNLLKKKNFRTPLRNYLQLVRKALPVLGIIAGTESPRTMAENVPVAHGFPHAARWRRLFRCSLAASNLRSRSA